VRAGHLRPAVGDRPQPPRAATRIPGSHLRWRRREPPWWRSRNPSRGAGPRRRERPPEAGVRGRLQLGVHAGGLQCSRASGREAHRIGGRERAPLRGMLSCVWSTFTSNGATSPPLRRQRRTTSIVGPRCQPRIFDALDDPTPIMLHVRHRAGDLDAAALAAGVEKWTKMWVNQGAVPEKIWFQAHARRERGGESSQAGLTAGDIGCIARFGFFERDHGAAGPTRRRHRRGHHAVWRTGARVPSPQPSDPPCASAALPGDRTRRQGRT